MRTLIRRVAFWLRRQQLDADLAEELESHRAMQQDRLERVRCAARRGRREPARSRQHHARARGRALRLDLAVARQRASGRAYALRSLRRNAGFSAALILVTALGIGATTSVFGLVDGLICKPLPVRDPERLVYFGSPSFSYPIFTEVRRRGADIFSAFFAWTLESVNVDWNGELEPARS